MGGPSRWRSEDDRVVGQYAPRAPNERDGVLGQQGPVLDALRVVDGGGEVALQGGPRRHRQEHERYQYGGRRPFRSHPADPRGRPAQHLPQSSSGLPGTCLHQEDERGQDGEREDPGLLEVPGCSELTAGPLGSSHQDQEEQRQQPHDEPGALISPRARRPCRCQGEQADHDADRHGGPRDRPVHRQVDDRLSQGCHGTGHSPSGTPIAQDGGQGAAHEPGPRGQDQHGGDRHRCKEGSTAPSGGAATPQGEDGIGQEGQGQDGEVEQAGAVRGHHAAGRGQGEEDQHQAEAP